MATFKEMIDRINARLSEFNQQSRVVEYQRSAMTFSNGVTVSGSQNQRMKCRLLSSFTSIWAENLDNLLSGQMSEKDIKHILARQRGIACQKIHGEKIRKNLNTGTPWIKGRKGTDYNWQHVEWTEEMRKALSLKRLGDKNPMYGKKHTEEVKAAHGRHIRNLIKDGKFTPKSNNRLTHKDAQYDGKKYRSSWEALYQNFNPSAKYEVLRIPYTYREKTKIYIVDFIDHCNKLVVEVKPKELCYGEVFDAKWQALQLWALEHNYTVQLVDQYWFINNTTCPDLTKFDENTARKIGSLYEVDIQKRNH